MCVENVSMKVATNSRVGGLLVVVASEMPGYPGRQATCTARAVSLLVEKNQVPFPNRRAFRLVWCLQFHFQTAFFGTWLSLDGYIKMVSKLWMEGSLCEVYLIEKNKANKQTNKQNKQTNKTNKQTNKQTKRVLTRSTTHKPVLYQQTCRMSLTLGE